jgi:hypothetical protein
MLCVAALCGMLIGCGGGSVAIDDLGSSLIDAQCDHYVACGEISSHDECVALLGQGASFDELVGSVNAGLVDYDGAKAQSCLDSFGGLSCDPSLEENRVPNQDCIEAVKGTVADGGACKNSNECVSGSCALTSCTMACCPGTCDPTPPAPADIGQSCATTSCVDGAFCNASGTCAALLAAGATCQSDNQCAYGTVCAGATALTCMAPPQKAGDACISRSGSPDCVIEGLYCGAGNKCAAYKDSGATCDPSNPCMFDLACNSTCGALPQIGDACPQFQCDGGAYCQIDTTTGTATTCAALKADGATCAQSSECDSAFCDTTTTKCAAPTSCI